MSGRSSARTKESRVPATWCIDLIAFLAVARHDSYRIYDFAEVSSLNCTPRSNHLISRVLGQSPMS
jgi:hypothetical protein